MLNSDSMIRKNGKMKSIMMIVFMMTFLPAICVCAHSTSKEAGQTQKPAGSSSDSSTKTKEGKTTKEGDKKTKAQSTDNKKKDRDREDFYITKITDDIFKRIEGKSFKDDCTLSKKDLRYLHVLHKDLEGNVCEGEMIVNKHIADDVLEILKELYEKDYPIEKIRLVDEYDADDEKSMEDNNSSCFNFRFISHTQKVSKHGLGLAVDINTLYNPYTKVVDGERIVEPVTAEEYTDRDADFDYKLEKGDPCYKLFTDHGFKWGGEWSNRKDYQHFEIPDDKIKEWYPDR